MRRRFFCRLDVEPRAGDPQPMLIWIVFALMTAALLAAVLRPLLAAPPVERHALSSADVYRAQLAELDADKAAGRVAEPEYQAARAEIGRRLIKASEAAETTTIAPASKRMPILAIVLVIAVPAIALPLYLFLGSPDYADQPLASRGPEVQNAREIERLTRELEAKLKSGKGDATGWMMLGRIKTQFGDFAAATDAYERAAAMLKAEGKPVPPDLHVAIGESLMAQAQGQITPRAADAFRKALAADPKHAIARFYLAVAKQTGGDLKGARDDLKALLADTPTGAPYRTMLEQRIRGLDAQIAPAPK